MKCVASNASANFFTLVFTFKPGFLEAVLDQHSLMVSQ